MRITKLHILALLLICGLAYSAYYYRRQKGTEALADAQNELALQKQQEEEARPVAQSSPTVPAPPSAPEAATTSVEYTVQRGDTLWKIAKDQGHFGAGHRWFDIWKANNSKIRDFDHIVAGQKIMVPLDKPESYEWAETPNGDKERILKQPAPRFSVPEPPPTN